MIDCIRGVNHITLAVRDLQESFRFYTEVLPCEPVVRWRHGAYLRAGALWLCLSVDRHARAKTLPEYTHIAFDINEFDLKALVARIRAAKVCIWKENTSEGESIYFVDPNGHRLELHANSLADRLADLRMSPYPDLEWFVSPAEFDCSP